MLAAQGEKTDHIVAAGPMHVVWALGQTSQAMHHYPDSGLEAGTTSTTDFYPPGEIKYHGHGSHRGYLTLDLTGLLIPGSMDYELLLY